MTEIERLVVAGRDLFVAGLVSTRAGNLSVRRGESMLITRTGATLPRLQASDFIEVPVAGPSDDDPAASSDLIVHRAIYSATDAAAVVHAHGPQAVVAGMQRDVVEPVDHEGSAFIPAVRVVEETEPRDAMAAEVARGPRLVIVRGHGTYAMADSVESALHWTTCLEMSCRILSGL